MENQFITMRKIVKECFNSQIIENGDKLYIRFDEGHFDIKWVEYEITKEESDKAMKSEKDNYQICLNGQQRNNFM